MSISGVGALSPYDAYRLAEGPPVKPRDALRAEVLEDAQQLLRELNAKCEVLDAFDNGDGADNILWCDFWDLVKGRKICVPRR